MQLFFIRSVQTGLVWCTKILTDPFHDVQLYHKSPLYLLRGELIDPMHHVHVDGAAAEQLAADADEPTKAGSSRRADRRGAAAPEPHGQRLAAGSCGESSCCRLRRRPPPAVGLPSPRRPRRTARRPRGSPRPCSCG